MNNTNKSDLYNLLHSVGYSDDVVKSKEKELSIKIYAGLITHLKTTLPEDEQNKLSVFFKKQIPAIQSDAIQELASLITHAVSISDKNKLYSEFSTIKLDNIRNFFIQENLNDDQKTNLRKELARLSNSSLSIKNEIEAYESKNGKII